jgi:thymidylate kinase
VHSGAQPVVRGLIIAFVGPDAAGKTTLCKMLVERLSDTGRVLHVKPGYPPPRPLTGLLRFVLRCVRKSLRVVTRVFARRAPGGEYPRIAAVLQLLEAFERRALARWCVRQARRGTLVIADRWPGRAPGAANGPVIQGVGWFVNRVLGGLERRVHASIPAPDVLIRMTLSVEETVRRNQSRAEPKPECVVRESHAATSQLRYTGAFEMTLDNHGPESEVLADLERIVEQHGLSQTR